MSNCGCCPPVVFAECACEVSADACNALTEAEDGLLVPQTELAGVVGTAPAATGTERSVDIDVVETPGCPNVWEVGARLTPASGFLNAEAGNVDLLSGAETDVPASDIVLPEVGTYHIDADVRYEMASEVGASAIIVGHLFDITGGVPLTSFTKIGGINSGAPFPGQEEQQGTTHIMTEYAIATAPRTVRIRLQLFTFGGTVSDAQAGGTDSNGATRMRFLKVRD